MEPTESKLDLHGPDDAAQNAADGRPSSSVFHARYGGNRRQAVTTVRDGGDGAPWAADCLWLKKFWDVVLRKAEGRVWRIGTLTEREPTYDLRDGLACVLVFRRLDERDDLEEHYYTAWASEPARKPPERDYFVIGRPHLYVGSEATPFMQPLAALAHGRFEERPRSRTAAGVKYGEQRFFQDERSDGGRQIKRDYAVLMFRRCVDDGEEVRLVSLAGLSALATLALTDVLTDPDQLDLLFGQVRGLLPPECPARFDEAFEICVRIDVDKQDLQNFANERQFKFEVEVVTGGDDVFFRSGPVDLVLESARGRPGGRVVGGNRAVTLSGLQFALVHRLVEHPEGASMEGLVDALYLMPKGMSLDGVKGSPATSEEIVLGHRAISKLVCVTNDKFDKISRKWRPIEHDEGRYVLRARVRMAEVD
jgi:hypothetical protein